jgi:hypothetical protein
MPSEIFYSPDGRSHNYKIRYAFKSSPFWGASMKDFQKFSNLSTKSILPVPAVPRYCHGSFDAATHVIRHSDGNSPTDLANSYVHNLR